MTGSGPFAGTGTLTRMAFRRDRLMLPAWVYLLTVLIAAQAYSFRTLFKTAASREHLAAPREPTRPSASCTGSCTTRPSAACWPGVMASTSPWAPR